MVPSFLWIRCSTPSFFAAARGGSLGLGRTVLGARCALCPFAPVGPAIFGRHGVDLLLLGHDNSRPGAHRMGAASNGISASTASA